MTSTNERSSENLQAPYVDVENLVFGADGSLPGRAEPVTDSALTRLCCAYGADPIRHAYAGWADLRVRRYRQALEHDVTAGLRDVDRVGDDEPNPCVDGRLSTSGVVFRRQCVSTFS